MFRYYQNPASVHSERYFTNQSKLCNQLKRKNKSIKECY